MTDSRILVGVFGAPHGVRGELRLKSYTGDPLAIAGYGPLSDPADRTTYELVSARLVKDDMLVVRVKDVDSRDAAAKLTNVRLHVPRAALPATDDEEEFYHADLIGLRVETPAGEPLGTVSAVLDFGAGDLLEIAPADGARPLMLPFTKAVVPVIDLSGRRIVVDPPAETEAREGDDGDGAE